MAVALLRVPNFARAALLVLAVVLTADIARRRGAHTARRLSLGLLVALGVQFVTAFQTDWQLHGSTAQTVVILAAVAGVLVGAGVARYDRGTDGAASPQRPASTWARHVRRGIALVRGWWWRTPIVQRAF